MWSRTASVRGLSLRPSLRRAGVAAAVLLASAGVGLTPAAAADAPVVDLDAGVIWWAIVPQENTGSVPIESPVAEGGAFTHVEASFGGSVTVTMPPQLQEQAVSVSLVLSSTPADRVSYSSDSTDPATDLGVTSLGGNQYRIDLPANDGSGRSSGELRVTGFVVEGGLDVPPYDPFPYALHLTAGGPTAVDLAPDFWTLGHTPCEALAQCKTSLTAGSSFSVVLPTGSRLDGMGVADLGSSSWSIEAQFAQSPATDSVTPLTAAYSADRRTATFTVPTDAVPGSYELEGVIGDGTGHYVHIARTVLEIAAPAVNPGLRSETGGDAGSPVLLPIVCASVAGLALAGAVRSRRRPGVQG